MRTEKGRSFTARLTGRWADRARLELCIRRRGRRAHPLVCPGFAAERSRHGGVLDPRAARRRVPRRRPVGEFGRRREPGPPRRFRCSPPQAIDGSEPRPRLGRDRRAHRRQRALAGRRRRTKRSACACWIAAAGSCSAAICRRTAGPPSISSIEPWMPMLVTVEAQLRRARRGVARASTYFHVTKRNRGQFNFLMWDFPTGTLAPYAEESLARHGMTLQLQRGSQPPPYVAAFDIAYIPYTTRILATKTAQGIMQPFCWNDEAAVEKHVSRSGPDATCPPGSTACSSIRWATRTTTLGCCLSPHCARAYRRVSPGDLRQLGRPEPLVGHGAEELGRGRAVEPRRQRGGRPRCRRRTIPRWFDRQAFKSYNYVKYCQQYAAGVRGHRSAGQDRLRGGGHFRRRRRPGPDRAQPQVLVALSGHGRRGDPLDRPARDAPGQLDGLHQGRRFAAGQVLADGHRAARTPSGGGGGTASARSTAGWPPICGRIRRSRRSCKTRRSCATGWAICCCNPQMQDDGIAMLYSYPSTFAQRAERGRQLRRLRNSPICEFTRPCASWASSSAT